MTLWWSSVPVIWCSWKQTTPGALCSQLAAQLTQLYGSYSSSSYMLGYKIQENIRGKSRKHFHFKMKDFMMIISLFWWQISRMHTLHNFNEKSRKEAEALDSAYILVLCLHMPSHPIHQRSLNVIRHPVSTAFRLLSVFDWWGGETSTLYPLS